MTAAQTNQGSVRFTYNVQWHITERCQQKCLHCYLPHIQSDIAHSRAELDFEDCAAIIDDLAGTFERWHVPWALSFTGGDPLLRADIYDLIALTAKRGARVEILGNPNNLTPAVADRLKSLGLYRYQVSIDGLQKTHDWFRGVPGLLQDTLRAIRALREAGILSHVMFTVSKRNAHELIDVIRLAADAGADGFDFARLVPMGSYWDTERDMFSPSEYRDLLLAVHQEYGRLTREGCAMRLGRKDHLWQLLEWELGEFTPQPGKHPLALAGCLVGISKAATVMGRGAISIMADGTVMSCPRLGIPVGKLPEQSMRAVLLQSKPLDELRQIGKMSKCGGCELLHWCRGCPGVARATHGSYYAPDPQCWKDL
jgi:radical SAM protein with 4Fe4S-binding SPASM domain